jgi:Domain of unknown function (DUF6259)
VEVVSLGNGQVEVEFATDHGQLLTVRHRRLGIDLVTERRLCENFRVLLPLPHRRGHYIFGRGQELRRAGINGEATEATLEWSGLHSEEGTFDLDVSLRVRLAGDEVLFNVSVENRTAFIVEEVLCPAMGGVDGREVPGDWRLHHPNWVGVGVEWPVFAEFPGSYLGPAAPVWFACYPRGMSMPWLDLYDRSRGVGAMLADLDERPAGAMSMAFAQLFPCTVWRGGRQVWPSRREAGDEPVAMTLGWARFPFVAPGAKWESGPVCLCFHEGTWWEAARHYRRWFDRVMPIGVDKRRSWLAREDAWQSTIISYPEGIRVLQLDGWHRGGIDRNYPDYRPDPRLGSEADLRSAIKRCQEMGVRVLLFANLQWANLETDWYRSELQAYAVKDPRGLERNSVGWEYHTLLGLANQCEPRMVMMDPSHEGFSQIIREQLESTIKLGADGLQIDKLGSGFAMDYAPGLPFGPDEAVMKGSWAVLEGLYGGLSSGVALASESHWDRAMPFVDASYARFFSEDHLPTTAVTFPEFRQTSCVVGAYDRAMVNNCIRYGHIVNLEMRCLHGDASDAPDLAGYVREVLALRRQLSPVLWDSRLVEAEEAGVEIDADEALHWSVHRSTGSPGGAVVLNHFKGTPLKGRVKLAGAGREVRLFRPGEQPEAVQGAADVEVGPEGLVVLAWGAGG